MPTSITAAPHGVHSKGTTAWAELLHHDFVDPYHVIIFAHLTLRDDEDLIYSSRTLQHLSPDTVTSLHSSSLRSEVEELENLIFSASGVKLRGARSFFRGAC